MEAGHFVLRKAVVRGEWSRMSKKGKKERRGGSSNEESNNEVIGVETGLDSDSEKERRKGTRSAKKKVSTLQG